MSIETYNWPEAANFFDAVGSGLQLAQINATRKWIEVSVKPRMKNSTAFRDRRGILRNVLGLVSVERGTNVVIFIIGWGPAAPWGKYLERGTRNITAKRFVENAIREAAPELPRFWVEEVTVEGSRQAIGRGGFELFTMKL